MNNSRPLIAEKNIMDGYQQQQQQQQHQLELNPPQTQQQQVQQHQQYYQQQQEHHNLYASVPQVSYYNTQPHHYQHQQHQQQNYNYEQQQNWHNQNYYNQQNPAAVPANSPAAVVVNPSGSSFQSYFPQQQQQQQQQVHQHHQEQLLHRPLSVPPPTQSPLQQHTIDSSGSSVENNHINNHSGQGQVVGPAPITNLARFVDTQQGQTGFIQHHHFQQQPQTFIPPAVSSPSVSVPVPIPVSNHNQQNSNHISNNPIPTPPSSVSSTGSGPGGISHSQQPLPAAAVVQSKPNIPVSAFVASVVATKSLPLISPTSNSTSNQQQQQHLKKQQPAVLPSNQINVNQSSITKTVKSPSIEVTNGITTNGTSNILIKPPNVGVARTKASMRKLLMEQLEDTQPGEKTTTISPSNKPDSVSSGSPKKNIKEKDNTPLSSTSSTPTKSGRGGRTKAEEKQDEEEAAKILLELQKDPVSKRQRRKSSNPPAAASKNQPEVTVDEKRTSTRKRESSEKAESTSKTTTTPKSAKSKSKQQTQATSTPPSRVGKRKRKNEDVDDDEEEEIPLDSEPTKEKRKRKYTYQKKVVRPAGLPKLGRPPKTLSDQEDVPIEGKRNSNLRAKRASTKITPIKKEKPQKEEKEKVVKGTKKAKLEEVEKEKSTGKIARKSRADNIGTDSTSGEKEKTTISNAETVEVENKDNESVLKNPKTKQKKAPRPKLTQEELNAVRRANLQKAKLAIALRMKAQKEKERELKERKAGAAIDGQKVGIKKAKLDNNSTILPPLDLTKVPESALKLEEGEIITNASRISLSPPAGTKQSQKMSKVKSFNLTGIDDEEGKVKKKVKTNKKEQVIKIIETKPSEPPKIPSGISQDGHSGEDLVALANEPESEEKITLFYEVSHGNQSSTSSSALPIVSQGEKEKIDDVGDVKIIPSGSGSGNKKKSLNPKPKKEKKPIVKKISSAEAKKLAQREALSYLNLSAMSMEVYEDSIKKVREAIRKQRKEIYEKNKLEKLKKLKEAEESGVPIPTPKRGSNKKKQEKEKETARNTRASSATLDEAAAGSSKKEIQILDIEQNIVATSNNDEIISTPSKATVIKTPTKTLKSPKKVPKVPKKASEINIDGEIIKSYDEEPVDFGEIPNIINNNQHVELNLKYPEINIIPIPRTPQAATATTTATTTGEVVLGKKSSPKVKSPLKSKKTKTSLTNLESPIRESSSVLESQSPSILSPLLAIPSTSTSTTPGSAGPASPKKRPKKPSKATGKMIKAPLTLESREQAAININTNTLFPRDIHLQDSSTADFSKSKSPTVTAYGPPLLTTKTGATEGGNQKTKKAKPSGPSVKMVNGKSKFKYNGESEYPGDEIKKAEEKLPREKPQNEFDVNVPWICCFCSKGPHEQKLGDLFGPYYLRTKIKVGKKLVSDGNPKEKWLHENCAIWAGGVVLIENSLKGLEAAIEHSNKTICTVCNTNGATIGCLKRKCTNAAHFPCAKENKWKLNFDTYHSFCSAH